jgi:hypothetical protein
MEPLRRLRESIQRLAGRAVGQDTQPPRVTQGMMRWTGMEADMFRWPVDIEASRSIQDPDGTFHFMADFSAVDGGEPIQ